MVATQHKMCRPSSTSIQKGLMTQQTGTLPCRKCKPTLDTLTIDTEHLEEIIIAASQDNAPPLVTPHAPCILNSMAQTHITKHPQLSMADNNMPMPVHSHEDVLVPLVIDLTAVPQHAKTKK